MAFYRELRLEAYLRYSVIPHKVSTAAIEITKETIVQGIGLLMGISFLDSPIPST